MSIQQVSTKRAKLSTILSRKGVVEGFASIRKNKPFDYASCDKDPDYAWSFERGRLLALIYDGPLKEGRYVTSGAIEAWKKGRAEGWIL